VWHKPVGSGNFRTPLHTRLLNAGSLRRSVSYVTTIWVLNQTNHCLRSMNVQDAASSSGGRASDCSSQNPSQMDRATMCMYEEHTRRALDTSKPDHDTRIVASTILPSFQTSTCTRHSTGTITQSLVHCQFPITNHEHYIRRFCFRPDRSWHLNTTSPSLLKNGVKQVAVLVDRDLRLNGCLLVKSVMP
jgi:hypothetical protein